jgi:hypothetical protein
MSTRAEDTMSDPRSNDEPAPGEPAREESAREVNERHHLPDGTLVHVSSSGSGTRS